MDLVAAYFWLRWLMRMDIYAADKGMRKSVPIFFGVGLLSGPLSLVSYGLGSYAQGRLGIDSSDVQYYFTIVGPSEELAKFLIFYVVSKALGSIREPVDAALQGASVGLGFAIVENMIYGPRVGLITMLFRSYYGITNHMSWAALSAFSYGAVVYWYERERERIKWGLVIFGICSACCLHGLCDFLIATNYVTFFFAYVLEIATVAALFVLLKDSSRLSPYYSYPFSEWPKAIDSLNYGIARDAQNWVLYQRRGTYHLVGRNFYEARFDFEMAVNLSKDPGCRAYFAMTETLLGFRDVGLSLTPELAAMETGARRAFLTSLRRIFYRYDRATELVRQVATIVKELEPPKPQVFRVQSWTGSMDRSREAIIRARSARARSKAVQIRRGQATNAKAAQRAFLVSSGERTSKEKVFARLVSERRKASH